MAIEQIKRLIKLYEEIVSITSSDDHEIYLELWSSASNELCKLRKMIGELNGN